MAVVDWIRTKASGWHAAAVEAVLAIAKKAAPAAVISIKWGQPVVEDHGPVAFIKVAKAHVTLGFWRGAELVDVDPALEGGDVMRHLKIFGAREIDDSKHEGGLVPRGAGPSSFPSVGGCDPLVVALRGLLPCRR